METNLPDRPKATIGSSSSEIESGPSASGDAKRPPSIPLNVPSIVIEKIGSQDEVIPIHYYNCTLHPHLKDKEIGGFKGMPMYLLGRWTFNNLPDFGIMPYPYKPIVRIQQDKSLALKKSANAPVQTDTACCLVQNLMPCVFCALRLQDGDFRALCRRDSEIATETCIECAYAKRTCTWAGFMASEEGSALVQARTCARKALAEPDPDISSSVALNAMQTAATTYLAAIWTHGNVYDLIDIQCAYNSSKTGKNPGMSQFLNQGAGLAMARNIMIREMLTFNRKISETLQKNNEILNKLLRNPPEENE